MNPPNVKKFDRKKADLKRIIFTLWQENNWSMTDDHFEGLRKKLHKGGYFSSDLEKAVYDYANHGGTYEPRFGDLVTFLRASKAGRKAGAEKLPEPSEADRAAGRAVLDKLHLDALPELSRAEQDAILEQLERPGPVTLPDKLRNLEPAKDDPPRPEPAESELLEAARENYQVLNQDAPEPEPEAEGPVIQDKDARRVLV